MKTIWTNRSRPTNTFAVHLCALILGYAGNCVAQAGPVPQMTIKIYNNSCQPACITGEMPYNIYPVLSSGTSTPDKYMQAILKVPSNKVADFPFPKTNQFRLYINPTVDGIQPGGMIELKLPFYSQLVPTAQVNPKLPDQYIDWWGGGRIEIFKAQTSTHKPPAALTADYNGTNPARNRQVKVSPLAGAALPALTTCKPGPCQPLTIFKDPAGLGNNEPSQLTEYTLGALNFNVAPSEPYGIDLHNVDYDVSYVDAAYLPAAMEPFNNDQVGYVGTIQPINTFRDGLRKFINNPNYKGWPQFVDDQKVKILKLPSPINIFGGLINPTQRTDLTPLPWPPIDVLKGNWDTCTKKAGTAPICAYMRDVRTLFQANFNNCRGVKPGEPTEPVMLSHVYGWTPFVDQCVNTASHLLEDTPGYFTINPDKTKNYAKYQAVKNQFDTLQYWPGHPNQPNGKFDPYLLLIHGKDYLNAPSVYAYSVDDAFGNMQVAGDGLIIAVGGPGGLPNPDPATPPINVSFGYATTDAVRFAQFGICTETPNRDVVPTFPSFAISSTKPENCPVSFVDNRGQRYTFKIMSQPPYPTLPPAPQRPKQANYAPVDCSGNRRGSVGAGWCKTIMSGVVEFGVFVHTVPGLGGSKTDANYAITRPAVNR